MESKHKVNGASFLSLVLPSLLYVTDTLRYLRLVCFGPTPSTAQGLLLLNTRIAPDRTWGPTVVLGIELRFTGLILIAPAIGTDMPTLHCSKSE